MKFGITLALLLLVPGTLQAAGPGLEGTWEFVPGRSTDIASWNYALPQIVISSAYGNIVVIHNWLVRGNVAFADTFECRPGPGSITTLTRSAVWPENWYMGVLSSVGDARSVLGTWLEPGKSLRVVTLETLRTSQGKSAVTITRDYTLGLAGMTLTLDEQRSSRPSPVVLIFERKEPSR